MAKRKTAKKTTKRKTAKKKRAKKTTKNIAARAKPKMSRAQMDILLIENFVAMQRVLTNLSIKFDNLADQTSKLLGLFEISAKSFAEKQGSGISPEDREFLEKMDQLMEQNKLIARGLTMMSERGNPPPGRPMGQMPQAQAPPQTQQMAQVPQNPVPSPLPSEKRLGSPSIMERHPISGR